MTFTGAQQAEWTTHLSTRNTEDQLPSLRLSPFLLCFFLQEGCSYKLNNNVWHMEKYFFLCYESFSCNLRHSVRRQRNTKSSHPHRRQRWRSFSWHKTWLISSHWDASRFLTAPPHFGLRGETWRKGNHLQPEHTCAVIPTQAELSLSWATRLDTFASMNALY